MDDLNALELPRSDHPPLPPQMEEVEEPSMTRIHLIGAYAKLFDRIERDCDDAFRADHLLHDPTTGARVAQRITIPLDVACDFPALADRPYAPLPELLAILAGAGELAWREVVTARMPLPDEQAAFGLAGASPILVTYRILYAGDRTLICEQLHAPASHFHLAYRSTPPCHTRQPTEGPPPSSSPASS